MAEQSSNKSMIGIVVVLAVVILLLVWSRMGSNTMGWGSHSTMGGSMPMSTRP